ncbi:MAG: C-terminal binding protein [Acetobacteraceae bacterium]|nr:C-terminal binding protein [Acetobacteraceae bacterium]
MSRTLKVTITDAPFPNLDVETRALEAIGAEMVICRDTSEQEILERTRDADGVLVCYAPVGARVIEAMERCRIIARYGIGVDNVDLGAATRRGIYVTNVPDYCVEEVADHTMALLLALARKVVRLNATAKSGVWDFRGLRPFFRLRGRILGLVGFGKIPRAVAARARAFGLEVWAYDPYVPAEEAARHGVKMVEFADLLREVDFLSVHTPLTPETRGMLGWKELCSLKPTSVLINTARGEIVEEEALVRAVEEGRIAGAALDVLAREGVDPSSPLVKSDRIILTPHVAYYSEESVRDLQAKAVGEVTSVLTGGQPRCLVNREVKPRPLPGKA